MKEMRKSGNGRRRQFAFLGMTAMLAMIGLNVRGQVTPVVYAEGFNRPVTIANAGDERLFVVERGGVIRIIKSAGSIEGTPFLDLSGIITSGGERGLLGLAFHPGYAENGYFFVNYTDLNGNTVIARYSVSADDPDVADPGSGTIVLGIDQPYQNHNGGNIAFGPDGYLYIGTGDGGSGGDPQDHAQTLSSLLGKMLRIDIDGGTPYDIPDDNPYVGAGEAAEEIWASGLRNPWRFSFDRETGDLWIADVGQNEIEEVNFVPSGTGAGWNFGWRCYEGDQEYNTVNCGSSGDYQFPVYQYFHSEDNGCSVTGGYVYRGTEFPSLEGYYFFTDYCNDILYSLHDSSGQWVLEKHGQFSGNNFSTFGEDMNGEIYMAGINSGTVWKITAEEAQTGISHADDPSWIVFPNPAANYIYIGARKEGQVAERVRLLNTSGKVVLDLTGDLRMGRLEVSGVTPGLYIVEISAAGSIIREKIILRGS
ncbi:MAG: PQQ-dependent sugar dehydrogenase [Bacteroidales bacterium]